MLAGHVWPSDLTAAIPVWNGVGRLEAGQQQMVWPNMRAAHVGVLHVGARGVRGTKRRHPGWAPTGSRGMMRAALLNPSKRRTSAVCRDNLSGLGQSRTVFCHACFVVTSRRCVSARM